MSSTNPTFTPSQVAEIAGALGIVGEVDLDQLRVGMEVELEHGRRDPLTNVTDDDPLLTARIALAHLRELPDYYVRLAAMEVAGGADEPRVRNVMTAEPIRISTNQTLGAADRLIRERSVSGLPVVDPSGTLVGVISRTDLMALASDPQVVAWQGQPVRSAMTSPALTIGPEATLLEAAADMEEHHVHRLVVVDPNGGGTVGILSTTDLVRSVAHPR